MVYNNKYGISLALSNWILQKIIKTLDSLLRYFPIGHFGYVTDNPFSCYSWNTARNEIDRYQISE